MSAYGVGVTIGICVGLAVMGALATLGILLMWCKSTDRCRCGVKLCLVVLCLLLIILCICATVLLVATILTSTVCKALTDVLSNGGFKTITDAFNVAVGG